MEASADSLTFQALEEGVPAFVRVERSDAASTEDAADQVVLESDEECTVEDVTVGEGEYPGCMVSAMRKGRRIRSVPATFIFSAITIS